MKLCVAGLGLIGGSICLALKRAGYRVDGFNRSRRAIEYALEKGIVAGEVNSFEDYDVVFVAMPPRATVQFILDNDFKSGAIITDVCGVKEYVSNAIRAAKKDIRFVGAHPMAGKEVSTVENACEDLFDRASMILTDAELTDPEAYATVKRLVKDMGFKRIVECSSKVHDRKIAYTSQLAHVVSNGYVKDREIACCLGFTGGSFQDMTRIAGVDERLWAELFIENASNLTANIDGLIKNLSEISAAIKAGDEGELQAVLRRGRQSFEECVRSGFDQSGEIKITQLK